MKRSERYWGDLEFKIVCKCEIYEIKWFSYKAVRETNLKCCQLDEYFIHNEDNNFEHGEVCSRVVETYFHNQGFVTDIHDSVPGSCSSSAGVDGWLSVKGVLRDLNMVNNLLPSVVGEGSK